MVNVPILVCNSTFLLGNEFHEYNLTRVFGNDDSPFILHDLTKLKLIWLKILKISVLHISNIVRVYNQSLTLFVESIELVQVIVIKRSCWEISSRRVLEFNGMFLKNCVVFDIHNEMIVNSTKIMEYAAENFINRLKTSANERMWILLVRISLIVDSKKSVQIDFFFMLIYLFLCLEAFLNN